MRTRRCRRRRPFHCRRTHGNADGVCPTQRGDGVGSGGRGRAEGEYSASYAVDAMLGRRPQQACVAWADSARWEGGRGGGDDNPRETRVPTLCWRHICPWRWGQVAVAVAVMAECLCGTPVGTSPYHAVESLCDCSFLVPLRCFPCSSASDIGGRRADGGRVGGPLHRRRRGMQAQCASLPPPPLPPCPHSASDIANVRCRRCSCGGQVMGWHPQAAVDWVIFCHGWSPTSPVKGSS